MITNATVDLTTNYFRKDLQIRFEVANDADINYPIILEMDFFHESRMLIDMSKRKLSKLNDDKSMISIYVDNDGKT